MEPKPGIKTTEFWMALVVVAVSAVAATYTESPIAQVGGLIAGALTAAGYGLSRAKTKSEV